MSHPTLQDQLLTNLITALTSRRCSPSYSTAHHWNTHALRLAHALLATAHASLATLLRRIIHNALRFQQHYRAGLATLQQVEAQTGAVAARQRLVAVFERDPAVRLDVGAAIEAQAERLEIELRAMARGRERLGPEVALGSHPVRGGGAGGGGGQQQLVRAVRLTPEEELEGRLERERERAGRGAVVEGVDEDMILRFWAVNLES